MMIPFFFSFCFAGKEKFDRLDILSNVVLTETDKRWFKGKKVVDKCLSFHPLLVEILVEYFAVSKYPVGD